MTTSPAPLAVSDRTAGPLQLGFLTVLRDANGYLGGYLVVNGWGRPLEFRLTSAVQPNRVQQILYGDTLGPYVCADLIGKTLVDRAGIPVQLVVTDREEVLDLRLKLDAPVVWLAPPDADGTGIEVRPKAPGRGRCSPVPPALRRRRRGGARPAGAAGRRVRPCRAVSAHPRGHRRSPQDGSVCPVEKRSPIRARAEAVAGFGRHGPGTRRRRGVPGGAESISTALREASERGTRHGLHDGGFQARLHQEALPAVDAPGAARGPGAPPSR